MKAVHDQPSGDLHLPDHGVWGGPGLARLRRRALDQVIRPCRDALPS